MELPDALRIAVSNTLGFSWQLELTSAAAAADPDGWTDEPQLEPDAGLESLLAIGSLVGPVLRYRAWDDGGIADVAIYVPDKAVWQRFDAALGRLGVWGWTQPAPSANVDSGTWEIALLWQRRRLELSGDGSWPPRGGDRPGPEWAGFLRAVHRLAGGRGFDAH